MEANLLRPSPCVATLQLRVYRAEDLPQGGTPQNLPFYYFGVGIDLGDPPPTSCHPRCSRATSVTGRRQEGLRSGGGEGAICRQDGGCRVDYGVGDSHFGVWGGHILGCQGECSQLCPSQLCTRVMPPDANPAWNEVFFFPLRVRCPPKIPHPFPKVGAPPKWGGHPHFNTPLFVRLSAAAPHLR